MKFVVTSDYHISSRYPLATAVNPLKDVFFKYAYNGAKQTIKYAIDNNMDILHGGDWFDHEKPASPAIFASFLLFNMIKNNTRMYINLGNHEIDYKEGIPSVLHSFANQYPNVYSYAHNTPWNVHIVNGLHIYMIPYFSEAIFNDHLEDLCKTNIYQPACLMIHQNIKGIQLGRTSINDSIISAHNLSERLKKKFKFIVCGHLHHAAIVDKFDFPVIIPGSTCAVDFRDEGSEKSFFVIELDDDYNLVNTKIVIINNQVRFKTMPLFAMEDFMENKGAACNVYFKIAHDIGEVNEYKAAQKKLMDVGAVGVTHDIIRQSENSLEAYARPVDMKIEEWLSYYLKSLGLNEEEMNWISEFDRKLFKDK